MISNITTQRWLQPRKCMCREISALVQHGKEMKQRENTNNQITNQMKYERYQYRNSYATKISRAYQQAIITRWTTSRQRNKPTANDTRAIKADGNSNLKIRDRRPLLKHPGGESGIQECHRLRTGVWTDVSEAVSCVSTSHGTRYWSGEEVKGIFPSHPLALLIFLGCKCLVSRRLLVWMYCRLLTFEKS